MALSAKKGKIRDDIGEGAGNHGDHEKRKTNLRTPKKKTLHEPQKPLVVTRRC